MSEKLTIAIIGCGRFAYRFIDLFKSHPNTENVYVCDKIREKAEKFAETYGVEIIDSFEEALARDDINCIGNYTRRHQHGDITIRALKAGKHVFSAVPMASTVDECRQIVELVEKTGLIYMLGETCYYYPCAMYCREAYKEGKFGKFYYGASQYYHHIDSISYGKVKEERGMPPLYYPTHSTAMMLAVSDTYAKKVTCFGNRCDDPAFQKDGNEWGNEFINQYVLMELANGGVARVTEARGFGYKTPSSYISAVYGSKGSYECSNAQHLLYQVDPTSEKEKINLTDVSDYLNLGVMVEDKNKPDFRERVANTEWGKKPAKIQEKEYSRLPKEYEGLQNGHMCSHQLLIDDFCKAVYNNEMPVLNAWFAARCNLPGLIAIESAKQGGVTLEVPDFGEPPKK